MRFSLRNVSGQRALLLPFPTLALVMGLAYLLGNPARTATPSFTAARTIAPLTEWGVVFLIGSAVLAVAILTASRRLLAVALFAGGTLYTWWAVLFASAAITDERASLTGWAVHGTVAFAHFAAGARIAQNHDVFR